MCQQFQHQMNLMGSQEAFPSFRWAWGGNTHNAKAGLNKVYDWLIAGSDTGEISVQVMDYTQAIEGMNWTQHASDHLPILISHA